RMLSVEEAKRYAGGFDDPARLASSFAGVASSTGENGIAVRGNAPKFVQWKMEGIEIPNPNHFGDLKSFGGGTFTALSSQMLANSDFFTGAFPAEYNNALSGVFDMAMRTGNNQKQENTFQIGVVGIDASSEGPFKKGGRASYLFNYRYSTLGLLAPLLPENASNLKFQDLSFKLNFPTQKAGIFSLWGIGLADKAGAKVKTDSTKWKYYDDKEENEIKQYMGAAGISHKYFFNNNSYLKTTLAATINITDWKTEKLNPELFLQPYSKIANANNDFVLSSIFTRKISAKHSEKTGIIVRGMMYDLLLNKATASGDLPQEIVNANGFSTLITGFSSSSFNLTDKLLLNIGIVSQTFSLNKHHTIEPRVGFRQQISKNKSIGFAYGLHSRLESLNYYFNNSLTTGETAVNKNLNFTKAHHLVLSYDWNVTELIHFKIEPYYQQLFSVPVIADSSYSFLNLQNDIFFADKLENTGEGRNYGVDITFEKYISKGYYYLFTASVFNSEYKGGDDVWRSTRFNKNYVLNFLVGKEWQVGKSKQNVFSLNTRFSYQGGNHYSPINVAASDVEKDIVYDETNAYKMQAQSTLNVHFTASYKVNKKHSSRELALKILNVTGQPDFDGHKYNLLNNNVDKNLSSVIIPNLSYKIEF
ncbi:MAG: TonB-dependent receptor, partial [Bacteroidota bacterium]